MQTVIYLPYFAICNFSKSYSFLNIYYRIALKTLNKYCIHENFRHNIIWETENISTIYIHIIKLLEIVYQNKMPR